MADAVAESGFTPSVSYPDSPVHASDALAVLFLRVKFWFSWSCCRFVYVLLDGVNDK